MKLAILIPTLDERRDLLKRLLDELYRQINGNEEVMIFIDTTDRSVTTGMKRNWLIEKAVAAGAECFAFHDDDDMPGPTYIQRGLEFADSGLDCAELFGQIYWSGKAGLPFHHSIIYDHWYQDNTCYFRNPNHLNFLRTDKVKDIKYRDITIGEDGNYSIDLQNAGVLKSMFRIPETLYHYYVGNPKHAI